MQKLKTALFLIVLGAVFAVPGDLYAQQVIEYAPVDSLKVGDTFPYSIVLNRNQRYDELVFPDSTHFGPDFEIRSRQHFKITDFRDSLVYRLQYFGTQNSEIPSLPVHFIAGPDTTTRYTTRVPVQFKSVLQSQQEQFRPLKPIFDFARAYWPYLLALLLLGILGWYLYRLYQQKTAGQTSEPAPSFTPEPFQNPLRKLGSTIRQLRSYTFESPEDFKQFYINLGDAIRTYFEDLYHISALEMTSGEILRKLRKRGVDDRLVEQTREVLNEADMVKFARFTPTEEQAGKALSKGEAFVRVAKKIDSPRIEHLRRQHTSKMDRRRKSFNSNTEDQPEESESQPIQSENQ